MAYRRKAPRTQDLPFGKQLMKVRNASVGLPFDSFYARSLMRSLDADKKGGPNEGNSFDFISSRVIGKRDLKAEAQLFKLPLPSVFLDPTENPDALTPRCFYRSCDIKDEIEVQQYFPRCGMSGIFFSREEVVDNLCAAAEDMSFKSPFWIKEDYKPLTSGYLSLKDDSEAIVISLTAAVASASVLSDLCHLNQLHPLLKESLKVSKSKIDFKSARGVAVPQGMNAISGCTSSNPFILSLPFNGMWVSYDQVLHLDKEAWSSFGDQFTLVEVDQWSLYNADQLTIPGRLGLKKSQTVSESIFTPL